MRRIGLFSLSSVRKSFPERLGYQPQGVSPGFREAGPPVTAANAVRLVVLGQSLALTIAVAGCAGNSTAEPSDVSEAVALVQQSLGRWQADETPGDLREYDPPIYVADDDWYQGSQLRRYSIVGTGEKHGTNVRVTVDLEISDAAGRVHQKNIQYLVTTVPALTIAREDR